MKHIASLICLTLLSLTLPAELLYKDAEKGDKKFEAGDVPMILLSITRIREKGTVQNDILTILADGTCYFKRSYDKSNNISLVESKRNRSLLKFGPHALPEEIRSALQSFFGQGVEWQLYPRQYVPGKETEIWLAELTLKYKTWDVNTHLSSTEKELPLLSDEGMEFLKLLNQINVWVLKKNFQGSEL